MSDSEDDMPMIARRRPACDAAPAAAPKPADSSKPTTVVKAEEATHQHKAPAAEPAAIAAAGVKPEPHLEPSKPIAANPAPVKAEAADSSDSDDDLPLASRKPPGESGAKVIAAAVAVKPAAANQPAGRQVPKAESHAAAKRRSSDGGTAKKAAAAPASKQQKQPPGSSEKQQQDKKPVQKAPAAAKKPAAKAAAVMANGAGAAAVKKDQPARVKKEFDLPGQTRETPDETDPLRKFYMSLLSERSDSAMARKWCVMNGLLTRQEAEEWVRANKGGRGAAALTPSKAPAKRPAAAAAQRAPPAKKAAAGSGVKPKPKPPAKHTNKKDRLDFEMSEGEGDDGDSSSDDDVPLAQRKAAQA
eukprot:GHRQ01004771.1.p1 GENE.GHRQ01004771.1~~GHRQ01004771.1.p1  ORF type:complete len:359 (+),score=183.28 GHRQ01004771.1:242-1318(+)